VDWAATGWSGTRAGLTAQPAAGLPLPVQLAGDCAALAPLGSIAARLVLLTPLAATCGVTVRLMPARLPAGIPPAGRLRLQASNQPADRLPPALVQLAALNATPPFGVALLTPA